MTKLGISTTKRIQISKANVFIVTMVSVACFVSIFALTASKTLWAQRGYNAKVINIKEDAKKQLEANLKARDQLVEQYQSFVTAPINSIGGTIDGNTDRDGDNAKIVLNALPSKYDYPAVAASLEKLMTGSGMTIISISGTDDEVAQSGSAAGVPAPVDVPFIVSFEGSTKGTLEVLTKLERSIRPMQIQKVTVSGNDQKLTTNITAKTYYLPAKTLNIKNEVVK